MGTPRESKDKVNSLALGPHPCLVNMHVVPRCISAGSLSLFST